MAFVSLSICIDSPGFAICFYFFFYLMALYNYHIHTSKFSNIYISTIIKLPTNIAKTNISSDYCPRFFFLIPPGDSSGTITIIVLYSHNKAKVAV